MTGMRRQAEWREEQERANTCLYLFMRETYMYIEDCHARLVLINVLVTRSIYMLPVTSRHR